MQEKTQYTVSVLILTDENVIIYQKYSHTISHIEVFNQYKELGIKVKDCLIIENVKDWNINDFMFPTINRFVKKNVNSGVEKSTLLIKCHQNRCQFILLDISGLTEDDQPFSFKPSELIKPQNNYFLEFMDI